MHKTVLKQQVTFSLLVYVCVCFFVCLFVLRRKGSGYCDTPDGVVIVIVCTTVIWPLLSIKIVFNTYMYIRNQHFMPQECDHGL